MKIIHISVRQAMELIAMIHENDINDASVVDLIEEVETATGASYDRIERRWVGYK